ncbi:MAG: hypothetical protein WBP29_06720 [Candidatus Zixiibacteriota bacterium]
MSNATYKIFVYQGVWGSNGIMMDMSSYACGGIMYHFRSKT